MKKTNLPTWEFLAKTMIWNQIGNLEDKKILDFGSGEGITANHFAEKNAVFAVELSQDAINKRKSDYYYQQKLGSIEVLDEFEDETFDIIFCHNVLEYVPNLDRYCKELSRVLKKGGMLSIVKHNPAGRVMQMAALLNDFTETNSILDGENSTSLNFGTIQYYNAEDIPLFCPALSIQKTYGIRTFWDLQQNQEIQSDSTWQKNMLAIETRVSTIKEYQNIAFFHHLLIEKI